MVSFTSKVSSGKNFEIIYKNPEFKDVLKAINELENGVEVQLNFDKTLIRDDHFQTTNIFPLKGFDFLNTIRKRIRWEKLFQLTPHLAQSQKVIYIDDGAKNRFTSSLSRFLPDLKQEKINMSIPENLSFLKMDKLTGYIINEYKFNISRFFIELLKYFEKMGGSVQFNTKLKNSQSKIIYCKPEVAENYIVGLDTPLNFNMRIKLKNYILRLSEYNSKLKVENPGSRISYEELVAALQQIISFQNDQIKPLIETGFSDSEIINQVLKTIKKPLACTVTNMTIKDNYEMSLEKFDIAKQSGINYSEFKTLYHRYGAAIDEITDYAYEQMNETRDPVKIWNNAENLYQIKAEWKA